LKGLKEHIENVRCLRLSLHFTIDGQPTALIVLNDLS
jgi:hypothetical protein